MNGGEQVDKRQESLKKAREKRAANRKKALEPSMDKVEEKQIIKHRGISMTKRERNERMKLEYVRGYSVEELAEKYDMSLYTVKDIRGKEKWNSAKKKFTNEKKLVTDNTLTQMYAGFKINVNVRYHESWEKLMQIVEMALDNPGKYLLYDDGGIRWGAMDAVASIIERAQKGQEKANGMMPDEVRYKLEVERDKLTLLRSQLEGAEGDEIVQDNFVEALQDAAKVVWADFGNQTATALNKTTKKE